MDRIAVAAVTTRRVQAAIDSFVRSSRLRRPTLSGSLQRSGCLVAAREGAVRFSSHFYNDRDEVSKVLAALDELV